MKDSKHRHDGKRGQVRERTAGESTAALLKGKREKERTGKRVYDDGDSWFL